MTDILAGNTDPKVNPYWGKFKITEGKRRRPATLKTGTNNDALDLSAYGYIGAPSTKERANGEYALAVAAWNGNSDNTPISTARDPLFSIDVTTYVWQGFLQEATDGWSINGFSTPDSLVEAAVDPWTGLAAVGGKRVNELFLDGTTPQEGLPADQRCGEAVLSSAGIRGRAQVVDGRQPGLDGPGGAGRRRTWWTPEHADGLLLQPGLQPLRPILGPAHGRWRGMRPTVAEPDDRPLRIAGSACVRGSACVGGPVRLPRDLPVAVVLRRAVVGAVGGAERRTGAHAGADARAHA